MSDPRPAYDDEIDLVEFFSTLWDGKWKILGAASMAVTAALGYQFIDGAPTFVATTEIRPISRLAAEQYRNINEFGFFQVTPEYLIDVYVDELEERVAFERAIRELGLINRADYGTQQDFEDAVTSFAASFEILRPNSNNDRNSSQQRFVLLKAEFNDERLWRRALSFIDEQVTASAQLVVQESFNTSLRTAEQQRVFTLEDLSVRIENLTMDYDRFTSDRLAFLKEQAAIARELDVASNTLEVQTFNTQNSMVAAVNAEIPFYLRGYTAIEKEIELIEGRADITAFVEGLRALEQQQREITQDRTLERAAELWNLTPMVTQDGFAAASMRIGDTDLKVKQSRMLVLALAGVLGSFFGVVLVVASNAVRKRKEKVVNT